MGCVKLVFFMLYSFLCQLAFSSSSSHLCPKYQALALLQFKNMFTVNPDASYYCEFSHPKTRSWNKSTDCCSWDGVHCDNTTGQVIELDLRCSQLQGKLHSNSSLFQLSNLKRLDLSYNDFTGSPISPKFVTTKGLDQELSRVLTTQIIIDLSKNKFEGHIPNIIGDLIGLRTLNLSHNVLEGHIPASFQNLSVLESLDLSSNKISGAIPQQLASLTFLEVLNLSHNHLVGCIPKGKQFDSFENSSYLGNDGLRGLPPSRDCGRDDQVTTPAELDQEEDSPMISWQAVLMGYGCGLVIGLSVIYIMWSTQYPAWFSRMDVKLEHIISKRMKKHKKRY